MRLAFMGTPDFAVPALEALIGAGHEIAAVYTRPPPIRASTTSLQRSRRHASMPHLAAACRRRQARRP